MSDLISREALKEAIKEAQAEGFVEVANAFDCVYDRIDNAPTVDVLPTSFEAKKFLQEFRELKDFKKKNERPQGEWKETGYETGALGITYRQTQCSNCGWEHALPMWWNFCPNCGAEMRKGGAE